MDSGGVFEAGWLFFFFPFSFCLPLNPSCILCGHRADADAGLSVPREFAQCEAA